MWRWSNAATSRRLSHSSMPLPKTSPDMSPMPTTVIGSGRRRGRDAAVAAHALPRATRGDAHLLVVVAVAATGSERVAEPEAVLGGELVGDVAERRRALVGGHHEVGVGLVVHDTVGRVTTTPSTTLSVTSSTPARSAGTGRCLRHAPRPGRSGRPSSPSRRTRPSRRPARSPRSSPSAPSSGRGSRCGNPRRGRSTAGHPGRSARHAGGRLRPSASTRRSRTAGAVREGTRSRSVAASPRSRRRPAAGTEGVRPGGGVDQREEGTADPVLVE